MNWLIGKDPDAGNDWRQEEKGMTEGDMVGWHHWLNGHDFEQALEVGDGLGSLVCCSLWGHKQSDTTEWMNWTDIISQSSEVLNHSDLDTLGHSASHMISFGNSLMVQLHFYSMIYALEVTYFLKYSVMIMCTWPVSSHRYILYLISKNGKEEIDLKKAIKEK